jgi:hypothetical protein
VLEKIFGRRLWLNYGAFFNRGDVRRELIPRKASCIHGHFVADAFSEVFPEATLVTWLRHPVERLVSNYHYFLRCPGQDDLFSRALNEGHLTLREFADMEGMRNVAFRHFGEKRLQDFRFVGITERFADSMAVFNHALGFGFQDPPPRLNANPFARGGGYSLSHGDFDYIVERNTKDLRMYVEAGMRLDRALSEIRLDRVPSEAAPPRWTVI